MNLKKTSKENFNFKGQNFSNPIIVLISVALGIFILIISLLKIISDSETIKIDPLTGNSSLKKQPILIKTKDDVLSFEVSVASTESARIKGLMDVKSMKDNEGMLFIFPDSAERSFWMKNTYIPLDIIFFDENLTVVNIHENTEPLNESIIYNSDGPSRYVLELNGGVSASNNIEIGSTMEL